MLESTLPQKSLSLWKVSTYMYSVYMHMYICMCFVYHAADTWTLFKLPTAFPKPNINPGVNEEEGDMSGIDMESPHKDLATAQEFPCSIPVIGDVCTSWIGQKGVSDLQKLKQQEETKNEVQAKSSELRVLATECLKAFEVAGLRNSDDPQVRKATDLCLLYVPRFMCKTSSRNMSCDIAQVWKQQVQEHSNPVAEGKEPAVQSLAESILGEKLIDTVTEKKRQAPDVSILYVIPVYVECACLVFFYIHLIAYE